MTARRPARGFTLVELMVTLSLSVVLMLVAAPLTGGWVSNNRQMQARGLVNAAVGRAKSIALRNATGVASDAGVAQIRFAAPTLSVHDTAGTLIWSAEVPESVDLRVGTAAFTCTAFNSRAIAITVAGCDQAATTLALVSDNASEDLNVPLY